MERVRFITGVLIAGTLWAGAFLLVARLSERLTASSATGHAFRVGLAGDYHLDPAMGNDLYAIARHADSTARTAHFLGFPLFDHYWGKWAWVGWTGSGASRIDLPAPTRTQFAPAARDLSVLGMYPGVDIATIAVPGGDYDRVVWHTPGVAVLLATSYLALGPFSTLLWVVATGKARRRRRARREAAGLCVSCGFERAGLAPNAPCPECGKVRATRKGKEAVARDRAS